MQGHWGKFFTTPIVSTTWLGCRTLVPRVRLEKGCLVPINPHKSIIKSGQKNPGKEEKDSGAVLRVLWGPNTGTAQKPLCEDIKGCAGADSVLC